MNTNGKYFECTVSFRLYGLVSVKRGTYSGNFYIRKIIITRDHLIFWQNKLTSKNVGMIYSLEQALSTSPGLLPILSYTYHNARAPSVEDKSGMGEKVLSRLTTSRPVSLDLDSKELISKSQTNAITHIHTHTHTRPTYIYIFFKKRMNQMIL